MASWALNNGGNVNAKLQIGPTNWDNFEFSETATTDVWTYKLVAATIAVFTITYTNASKVTVTTGVWT